MRSAHASYITEKPINVCNLAACLCLTVIQPFSPPPPHPPSGPSNLMSYGLFFRPRSSTKLPVAYFLGLGILHSSWNKNSIGAKRSKEKLYFEQRTLCKYTCEALLSKIYVLFCHAYKYSWSILIFQSSYKIFAQSTRLQLNHDYLLLNMFNM